MNWSIRYTEKARNDLQGIYEYIAYKLSEPTVAENLIKLIIKNINSLCSMPDRHRLYENEPWHNLGLRFIVVKKYLVFYLPMESDKTVYIVRIIYGGRDIADELNVGM